MVAISQATYSGAGRGGPRPADRGRQGNAGPHFIQTEAERERMICLLEDQPLPFAVSITKGGKRTLKQNGLQMKWMGEVAAQLGDQTAEEIRGFCKLTIGVPIMRAESPSFREQYDAIIRPLPYEHKLAMMMEPFDFKVTRLMDTKQFTTYLDGVHRYWSSKGIALTDPGELLKGLGETK